jgi:hypothetical protein
MVHWFQAPCFLTTPMRIGCGLPHRDQYNGRPPAISRTKYWYGRPRITLHGHYGRPFCLINLNIFFPLLLQILLTKSVIFNTCKQRFGLLENHRIWLGNDPYNNNVISFVTRNILYYIYCYWVSCRWYCVILLTIMHMHMVLDFWYLLWFWFLVPWQLTTSLLRIIKCPIMSDQNMGWSDTISDQVFRIILNSVATPTVIFQRPVLTTREVFVSTKGDSFSK